MGLVQDVADLEGWKEVSAVLGVAERTAQKWAARKRNPLPVLRGTPVRASTEKLRAWVAAEFNGEHNGATR